MMKVFPKMHGVVSYDPVADRIASVKAREMERLGVVHAQAVGLLRRVANMKPNADGTVDLMELNAKLAGKPIHERMVLKTMLAECGMIPVI